MALIDFTVSHQFAAPPRAVWDEMIDWSSHGNWIPATRIEVDSDDSQVEGATFTGYTGFWKLALVDRMRISAIEWDQVATRGSCDVEKLGPVLEGKAGFVVAPDGDGSSVEWFEQVTVPYLPNLLAPVVSKMSAAGFAFGMRRLAKIVEAKNPVTQRAANG